MSRQAVLSAVRVLTADGWPASVREIQEATGHASPSTVHSHLVYLEAIGYVERHPRRPKGGWMPGLRRDSDSPFETPQMTEIGTGKVVP